MFEEVVVKVKQIENGILPIYKRDGDVCLDCFARKEVLVKVGKRSTIPLGFAMELPYGYEAVIRPRSGLSKDGIDEVIGTIDTNYRGEVMACIINNSDKDFQIHAGDRICQLAIREAPKVVLKLASELSESNRGSNGFGSSGI